MIIAYKKTKHLFLFIVLEGYHLVKQKHKEERIIVLFSVRLITVHPFLSGFP